MLFQQLAGPAVYLHGDVRRIFHLHLSGEAGGRSKSAPIHPIKELFHNNVKKLSCIMVLLKVLTTYAYYLDDHLSVIGLCSCPPTLDIFSFVPLKSLFRTLRDLNWLKPLIKKARYLCGLLSVHVLVPRQVEINLSA